MDTKKKYLLKIRIFLALLFAFTFVVSDLYAQTFQVSGSVIAASTNKPLPGVNILETGTQNGTSTDENGEFSLAVSGENGTLRFSFIGFKTKMIKLQGRSRLQVELKEVASQMSNVIVTALSIGREERSLGYSVSQVETKDLVTSTVTNTSNLLQGQVAGVHVSPTAGGPGSASRVTIRGTSSLSGDNQPLYVVDGIPIDNSNFRAAGLYGGAAGGDGISQINPKDIESITVLKGASAAALYGTRARNGVIQITTKSGKATLGGGPLVEFNSTVSVKSPLTGFTDYQDKYGQGHLGQKPQSQDDALGSGLDSWGAPLDGSPVVQYDGVERPYASHGDQVQNFYRNAVSSKNSISLSGGDQISSYYFNTSYQASPSIRPNSSLERTSFTLRGTHDFGHLHADAKANYIRQTDDNQAHLSDAPGNANATISRLPPNISTQTLKNNYMTPEGREFEFQNENVFVNNPYWVVNQWNSDAHNNRIIGFAKLDYDFTDWISLTLRSGIDNYTLRQSGVTPWGTAYRPDGDLSVNEYQVLESDTDLLLNIERSLSNSFDLNATFGGSRDYNKNENVGVNGDHFKVPKLQTISNMANITPIFGYSSKQINSVYGSVDLSYNDYLFVTATGRNDWSSTLPKGNNSYFYPSISGSFVFSDAFSSAMPDWLSFGKLRASWGEVGSDTSPYQLNLNYNILSFTHQGQSVAAIAQDAIPLANLKPTLTKAVELGFNVSFLENRLGLDLSVYKRKTTNQILATNVSPTTGYGSRVINAGRLDNKGIEILLKGDPVRGRNLEWNSSINFTRNISEVKELAGEQQTLQLAQSRTMNASITATVGQEYGTIRGYKYKRDDDGNLVLNNGLPVQSDEQQVLGRGTPDWTAGWNNTLHYKNVSLNFLVDVNWGGQIYSATNAYAYGAGLHKNTLAGRAQCDQQGVPYTPCFVAKGVDINGGPNETAVLPSAYYGRISTDISEQFVYDANFVKLRQLSLGYNLPQTLIAKTPLRSITVSAIGRNLLYFYNSVPNVDPESAINRDNGQGLELAGLPARRTVGLNVSLKF